MPAPSHARRLRRRSRAPGPAPPRKGRSPTPRAPARAATGRRLGPTGSTSTTRRRRRARRGAGPARAVPRGRQSWRTRSRVHVGSAWTGERGDRRPRGCCCAWAAWRAAGRAAGGRGAGEDRDALLCAALAVLGRCRDEERTARSSVLMRRRGGVGQCRLRLRLPAPKLFSCSFSYSHTAGDEPAKTAGQTSSRSTMHRPPRPALLARSAL